MKFVITGILDKLTRSGAEKMIRDFGHQVTDSVRANTDYLVIGIRPGNEKLSGARRWSTKVIKEDQFMKLMNDELEAAKRKREQEELKRGYAGRLPAVPARPWRGADIKAGTLFMIAQLAWRYNDEYYKRGEGSTPVKLYRSRSRAEYEMAILEQKALKNIDLIDYVPEGSSNRSLFTNYEHFRAVLWLYSKTEIEEDIEDVEYGDKRTRQITDILCRLQPSQFVEVKRFLKFGFFEVVEVAMEG